jgi:hypothetical protein
LSSRQALEASASVTPMAGLPPSELLKRSAEVRSRLSRLYRFGTTDIGPRHDLAVSNAMQQINSEVVKVRRKDLWVGSCCTLCMRIALIT